MEEAKILYNHHGFNSDDYYYIKGTNNSKRYYSKINNRIVNKGSIDLSIINQIKEQSSKEKQTKCAMTLIDRKSNIELKINELNKKLFEINNELSNIGIYCKQDEINLYNSYVNNDNEIKARFKAEKEKRLKDIFKQHGFNYKNTDKSNTSDNNFTSNMQSKFNYPPNILHDKNIQTRKEWFKWLLENHSDKGGNAEECKNIISAGRDKGW